MNRRAPEPFVVFLPVARKRQADDLLDAFDMQTELLMDDSLRAVEYMRICGDREAKAQRIAWAGARAK